MAVLESDAYDKVIVKGKEALQSLKENNFDHFDKYSEEAWNLFPDPKESWNQAFNFSKMILKTFLEDNKLEKAEIWYNRMRLIEENLGLWPEEYEFYSGVIYFEKEEFEKAQKHFNNMFQLDKGRSFEGEDPKYKDFYLNPKKYIS
ncbi:hypothetical protein [Zobellia nedashkovskayae]|uniref:hypothetical protein n=1 Tax=Zobellia nedashkovskayae TaxID=2779510 RepID=UPI00188CCC5A|nr:hypothetical protein [Zobellia nedashkovskayae]